MSNNRQYLVTALVILASILAGPACASAQAPAGRQSPARFQAGESPVAYAAPSPTSFDRPMPINLPTALRLAGIRPLDVEVASQRIQQALAQLDRANVLWLPTIFLGTDYFRHDGQIQDVAGNILGTSKSSFMVGAGPSAVFAVTDALFEPLAARQLVRSREAALQAARNDTMLAVTDGYFQVQQTVGELAGAAVAAKKAADLLRQVEKLAPALVPTVEVSRARAELARRRQVVHSARERWRTASAELARVLRLDPSVLVRPLEPPHLRMTLLSIDQKVDDLIPVALTNRPELAAQQALVQATLQRLRQERIRPLVPSVLIRGGSTPVAGTLAAGGFEAGRNDSLGGFGARMDFDVQVLWELRNLGFGNLARVKERRAENQLAMLELFRIQDRVAADVVHALAQARSAATRLVEAEAGLKDATESVQRNFEGLSQTKRVGNLIILVIRPQEVVAAVQALAQAYNDYYGVVADYNRAQLRLYWALGHPSQLLANPEAEYHQPAGNCRDDAPPICVPKKPVLKETDEKDVLVLTPED